MKIIDLITWFENWAPPSWQESWDNCGWQIEPVILDEPARVLVCLTPTLTVMQEAISLRDNGIPVNLIFAHHPLIFSPLKSLQSGNPIAEMVRLAYTHKIGVYTAHTNFDRVNDGTADMLAQILQLKQVTPITPSQDGLGYGRVGYLEPSLTLKDLLTEIQTRLSPPNLIFSPESNLDITIDKVAVLGGSGASFISAVVKTGAKAYLTSDCKFHQFQEARDRGIILIDAGHYATERPACDRLVQKFRDLGVEWAQLSQKDEDFRQFFQIT
ncbi:Nif3-like dinuclear metal center hexameric protein [Planktothrix sp. FACHB-1355]|uniref:GTP cyclohydrolase 1 type 2 homolog n=1 Tax=Aerosakkonema funiforme FACHB-1375 TaxID=2949571 RepID=A0A926VES1_9CYAN|nr:MULTISPECIES: Nif3-like dinuclear metal center hexameric protein [Oscillatoriales]MBD2181632.1 Nif3-like dinuclear metal center hexameric protein [Aerosakkonema funiforme FACHB-1375]MBD3559792.1 Nif3-like dinuclear metal center hexameric protein [Planktothrix sp. FACHB-1355]